MGLFQRLLSAIGLRKQDPELDGELSDDDGASDRGDASESGTSASASVSASASKSASSSNVIPAEEVIRDPELEAQDDPACFDFERDIARYFTAEFRIEQAWQNGPRRAQLFSEYQVRDGAHWYQVKATFERWLESPEGKAKYPSPSALMQARMTTTQTVTVDELEAMIDEARRAKGS